MDAVYSALAARLDELPHGFPATPGGVELRILAKIFSPEDAAAALALLPIPEEAAAIARRLRLPVGEARAVLDGMAARGQIASLRHRGRTLYALVPFVVGIYEFQQPRMDAELAELFEEYVPALAKTLGGSGPALGRVVPVNAPVPAKAEILRYESVAALLARARSIQLMPCVCRTERAALGSPCSHPVETCFAFSSEEHAYETFPAHGRAVTREEALQVLAEAERAGLVHCTYNVQRGQMFVCNCCSCCCGFLRGVSEFRAPHVLVRSNYVAEVDGAACTACRACARGRCPTAAITLEDGCAAVDATRCIGCGVCTVACHQHALALVARPSSEQTTPPRHIVAWSFQRAASRRGLLRAVGQFGRLAVQHRFRRGGTPSAR